MAGGSGGVSFRQVMGAIALVLALIFVFQNNDRVEMHFIILKVTASLWVGLVVSILLGVLLGLSIGALRGRRRDEDDKNNKDNKD